VAELSAGEAAAGSCCAPKQQATCCEPGEKADCCAPEASRCGCAAGEVSAAAQETPLSSTQGPLTIERDITPA
jgi:hypothetical protein